MSFYKIFVVFFRPLDGNYQHWALHLDKGNEHETFEVDGSHPEFQRNAYKTDPRKAFNFIGSIYVGLISSTDVPAMQKCVSSVDVNNETIEWDCQDYVLEILDKLEEETILEEDDEDYKIAREDLLERRGAIL